MSNSSGKKRREKCRMSRFKRYIKYFVIGVLIILTIVAYINRTIFFSSSVDPDTNPMILVLCNSKGKEIIVTGSNRSDGSTEFLFNPAKDEKVSYEELEGVVYYILVSDIKPFDWECKGTITPVRAGLRAELSNTKKGRSSSVLFCVRFENNMKTFNAISINQDTRNYRINKGNHQWCRVPWIIDWDKYEKDYDGQVYDVNGTGELYQPILLYEISAIDYSYDDYSLELSNVIPEPDGRSAAMMYWIGVGSFTPEIQYEKVDYDSRETVLDNLFWLIFGIELSIMVAFMIKDIRRV